MVVGSGGVMATMNQSSEAAASGIGGWFEGVSYQAGLSGGSWATGSFVANGGILPTDLVNQVWNLQSNLIYPSEDQVAFYTDLVSPGQRESEHRLSRPDHRLLGARAGRPSPTYSV